MESTIAKPVEKEASLRETKKILAVDDNPSEIMLLESALGADKSYHVFAASDGRSALVKAAEISLDAVILDLKLPGMSGLEVLSELKKSHPRLPVIMLTGAGDIHSAVEAIKAGAHHYLTKPFENEQLLLVLRQAMEQREWTAFKEETVAPAGPRVTALPKFIGASPAIREVMAQIRKVAKSHLTVLIQGETGVGKEPAARALHEEGSRHDKPFVAVDCGALPENLLESELFGHEKGAFSGAERKKQGQIELAEGGTLFLDEIGNLPFSLQSKLLRVLEERQVRPVGALKAFPINVRFIAASNSSLTEEAKSGRFRHDLYYRLAEFTLQLPPLRCRREDIFPLAERFREEACREFQSPVTTLSREAVILLKDYPWPGNVRELRNVIRQSVLLTHDSAIHAEQVRVLLSGPSIPESPGPTVVSPSSDQGLRKIVAKAAAEVEKQTILQVLRAAGGNKSQAAKTLQVDYKTLRLKIQKYGLQIPEE